MWKITIKTILLFENSATVNHHVNQIYGKDLTQPAFTYRKLTMETLEQGVKYVQSQQ